MLSFAPRPGNLFTSRHDAETLKRLIISPHAKEIQEYNKNLSKGLKALQRTVSPPKKKKRAQEREEIPPLPPPEPGEKIEEKGEADENEDSSTLGSINV